VGYKNFYRWKIARIDSGSAFILSGHWQKKAKDIFLGTLTD